MTSPAIILVNPQMGENIGAAARAMLNFGLTDLRIVNPRDGWPNEKAQAMAASALEKMPPVQVFSSTPDAIANCQYVYATTARPRDMVKPVFTPKAAAEDALKRISFNQNIAFLFGAERSGLENDDVAQANAIITIPANPDFTSINIGQAVLLLSYELFQIRNTPNSIQEHIPASQKDFQDFMIRLEQELEESGFFRTPDMKPIVVRNIRNALSRSEMTEQEIRTLHGIITALKRK